MLKRVCAFDGLMKLIWHCWFVWFW